MKDQELKKFSADEWDVFLTWQAECLAPYNIYDCMNCIFKGNLPCRFNGGECLVCACFGGQCGRCMPDSGESPCNEIPMGERVDRLIERLEKAGIFEGEA